jgi:hypothetical protein
MFFGVARDLGKRAKIGPSLLPNWDVTHSFNTLHIFLSIRSICFRRLGPVPDAICQPQKMHLGLFRV